jgi:hypothetical protein
MSIKTLHSETVRFNGTVSPLMLAIDGVMYFGQPRSVLLRILTPQGMFSGIKRPDISRT